MIQNDPYSAIQPFTHYNENGKEFSNRIAEGLHAFGTLLTRPASWWLDGAVRFMVLDLKPGWQNQYNTKFKECSYRVALGIVSVVTLPFALLMSILGAPMRALASQFKADFILAKPAAKNHSKDEPTILSFNTLLMPEFISRRNKCRPTMERVHEIAQFLIESNDDVICLQEVFHTEAAAILRKKLTEAGYYVISNIGDQVLGLNSGLFMASKRKLENVKFYQHPFKDGVDDLANKGVLIATTKVRNQSVLVTNYHANGGGDKIPGYACRYIQQEAATAHIERYIKDSKETFAGEFFIGDTNVGPTESGERNAATNELVAVIDPEWELSDHMAKWQSRLSNWQALAPKESDVQSKKQWILSAYFRNIILAFEEGLNKKIVPNLDVHLQRLCTENRGGPVPSRLYTHDLHKKGLLQSVGNDSRWVERAKAGSMLDLDQDPGIGFKAGIVKAAPRRLDFVAVRVKDKAPKLKSVVVVTTLVADKAFSSDHLPIRATIQL